MFIFTKFDKIGRKGEVKVKKLYLIGSKEFQSRNQQDFIVYYYMHMNEEEGIYGIRLEQRFIKNFREIEYAEEKGVTESREVAEALARYLIDYEVMPVALPETIDGFFDGTEE